MSQPESVQDRALVAVEQLAAPIIGLAIVAVLDLPPAHPAPVGSLFRFAQ